MTEPKRSADELAALFAEYARLTGVSGHSSSSSLTVNMGGWGMIVAAGAAVICLIVMAQQNRAIDRLQAEMIDKSQQAREERAALKESQETQQAYLNVLLQNSKKEQK